MSMRAYTGDMKTVFVDESGDLGTGCRFFIIAHYNRGKSHFYGMIAISESIKFPLATFKKVDSPNAAALE